MENSCSRLGFVVTEEGVAYNKKRKYCRIQRSQRVLQIYLSINIAIHRLQAFQKYGDLLYEEGTVVRHLNGDPGSNAWDNIIGTMSDNMFDIPKQIRIRRAEHASSLSHIHDHVKIKQWHINNGASYKNIQ
jgi:hypothetical protein